MQSSYGEQCAQLLADLLRVQLGLQEWLLAWYKEDPAVHMTSVDITKFPWFVLALGSAADTFPLALDFSTSPAMQGHLTYWETLLRVRIAIYDLLTETEAVDLVDETRLQHFKLAVDEVADAIDHLLSPQAGYANGMVYMLDGGTTAGTFG